MVKNKSGTSFLMDFSNFYDVRQTKEYACFMEKIGWQVEKIENDKGKSINVFIKKLPILPFSVIKTLRYTGKISLEKTEKLKKIHRAFFVKLEPFDVEKAHKGRVYFRVAKDAWPFTPTKTLWIDLSKPERALLSQMKQKARYNVGKAKRNKIKIEVVSGNKVSFFSLKKFYSIWIENKPHSFLFKPSFDELKFLVESFSEKCFFVFAFKKHEFLGGSLQLCSKNMCFYWHSASGALGRRLFGPTLCAWEAIKEAKKRRLAIFDFEGMWDERFPKLNKGWLGFSKFKEGFLKNNDK